MSEKEKMNSEELEKVSGGSLESELEEYEKHHCSICKCKYCGKEYKVGDAEYFYDACHECRKIPLKDRVIKS